VLYLEQAGDRAWGQYASAAAEGYYRKLVELLDRLGRPLEVARVREKLGSVLDAVAKHEAAMTIFGHALEAYRRAGDIEGVVRVATRIGFVYVTWGIPCPSCLLQVEHERIIRALR
jgi:hypothetical protein